MIVEIVPKFPPLVPLICLARQTMIFNMKAGKESRQRPARVGPHIEEVPSKNEPMKGARSLHQTFLLSLFAVILLCVGMIGYVWISYEFRQFHKTSDQLRDAFIDAQKAMVKNEVGHVIDFINYQRNRTEKELKEMIRSRVYEAAAIAGNLHAFYKDRKSTEEIAQIIRETLRPIRFQEGRGYYFIYDMDGNNILSPYDSHLEGTNLWDLVDSKGLYTIRRFIRMIEAEGEGFLRWHWYKPGNTEHMSEKIGFARYFEPLDWWIGTGEYIADMETDIQAESLEWINKIRFGDEGYIFAYTFDGVTLSHYNQSHIGKSRWEVTDLTGRKLVQDLIAASRPPGGGYLTYVATLKPSTGEPSKKVSYVRSIPEWEWMVGAGVYIDDIERILAIQKRELWTRIEQHLVIIGGLLVGVLIIAILLARYISRKTFANLREFLTFFQRSAIVSTPIDDSRLDLAEFKTLARSANRMVEERNKAVADLKNSQERLDLALASTEQGLWDWNIRTGKVIWDERLVRIVGYDLADVQPIIDSWFDHVHPDDLEKTVESMKAHLKGHTDKHRVEFRLRSKSGGWKWILDQGRVIERDADGHALRAVGTYIDITARKEAEAEREALQEQLNRSRKMEALGLLAGGVAHDLNNVLSGIVSYPELLMMNLPEDSPLHNPLETIRKSGVRAAAIVQDLLTLARRGVVHREVVNLNDIISDYLTSPEHADLRAQHPAVAVETDFQPDLANIEGSPVHLKKTVMNLVSNAAEAHEDAGAIRISTRNRYVDHPIEGCDTVRTGEFAVLCVADEGAGISAADIEHIFEPFYTKKIMGRSGTGLGMAVVWGAVQDHNGYIHIDSVENRGTVIEIYFPATRHAAVGGVGPSALDSCRGSGESILVVDDVPEQREIAMKMLEKLGYRAASVESGEAAVVWLADHQADLLVLDMIMDPGMNGLETYRRIIGIYPGQKAVIASGYAETDNVREALRLGAGGYIKKPYSMEELGKAVRAELDNASKKQEGNS